MSLTSPNPLPLRQITLSGLPSTNSYPFNLAIVRNLQPLIFSHPVTFFVGENGSGKSTLLETIACAAKLPSIGDHSVDTDPTLEPARQLARHLKWEWSKRNHRGFFMRSEDFFGYAKRIQQMRSELENDLERARNDNAHRGKIAQGLSMMAYAGQLHGLKASYGEGLDVQSHGESYFKLFQARFVPHGLYLLDEPEAPLSPMRQLALMALMKEMIAQGGQFIIATHSPILLAYPHATIYHFEGGNVQSSHFEELEHVRLTRDFLNNPSLFLSHLLDEDA